MVTKSICASLRLHVSIYIISYPMKSLYYMHTPCNLNPGHVEVRFSALQSSHIYCTHLVYFNKTWLSMILLQMHDNYISRHGIDHISKPPGEDIAALRSSYWYSRRWESDRSVPDNTAAPPSGQEKPWGNSQKYTEYAKISIKGYRIRLNTR